MAQREEVVVGRKAKKGRRRSLMKEQEGEEKPVLRLTKYHYTSPPRGGHNRFKKPPNIPQREQKKSLLATRGLLRDPLFQRLPETAGVDSHQLSNPTAPTATTRSEPHT